MNNHGLIMEKLTVEQKAQAYDLAIERAKKWYNAPNIDKMPTYGNRIIEEIFPELKESESEDEKIRKSLLNFFVNFKPEDMWDDDFSFSNILTWFEKQGKQKPVDKVKFKVGDWVVSPNGVYWHIDKISNNRYEVTSNTGESSNWNLDTNIYHKFTIQDVKDGDVLCSEQIILLFKKWEYNSDWNCVIAYAGIDITGKLQITNEHWLISNYAHPATKEQRDLLFQKMKDAGYEWDAEKKEPKKIEESENIKNQIMSEITDLAKDYITQKSAWSGEDNTYYDDICEILINLIHSDTAKVNKDVVQRDLNWLTSIKQRIETK